MKTWEMLRDIKPGEVWRVISSNRSETKVAYKKYDDYCSPCLVFVDGDCIGDLFVVNQLTMQYDWKKEPKLVDFPEAFEAYEAGKKIRPERRMYNYQKIFDDDAHVDFPATDIRSKWEILE